MSEDRTHFVGDDCEPPHHTDLLNAYFGAWAKQAIDDLMSLMEAARLVANPNIEAVAILICELVFGEDWDREIPLVQFNEAKRYVAAALTPEDTK